MIWSENVMINEISREGGGGLAGMRGKFHLLEKKKDTCESHSAGCDSHSAGCYSHSPGCDSHSAGCDSHSAGCDSPPSRV